jgi:hypothetical protein
LQAPCETAEVLLDECLARLERAVKEGELPASTDTRAVASFYITVLNGLALQARDGASVECSRMAASQIE